MNKAIEEKFLEKILYVGEEIPEAVCGDKRPKFILLGTPDSLIEELQKQFIELIEEVVGDMKKETKTKKLIQKNKDKYGDLLNDVMEEMVDTEKHGNVNYNQALHDVVESCKKLSTVP